MQNDNSLVSVNIVTYNQEEYIAQCLDSVLAQTYQNIEIIVADDASSDKTPAILKEYKEKYPDKINLILASENVGLAKNVTKGMIESKGDFYTPFAGDDIMLPNFVKRQKTLLDNNPKATMVHSNALWFDSDSGKILREHHKNPIINNNLEALQRRNFVCAITTMVRKKYMPKGFRDGAGGVADWLYAAEILNQGDGVYCHEPLVKYRQHNSNMSDNKNLYIQAINSLKMMEDIGLKIYPMIQKGYARCYWQLMKSNIKNYEIHSAVKNLILCGYRMLKFKLKR